MKRFDVGLTFTTSEVDSRSRHRPYNMSLMHSVAMDESVPWSRHFFWSRPFFQAGFARILQPPANGEADRTEFVLQHDFGGVNGHHVPRT